MKTKKIAIILPAYNEELTISDTIVDFNKALPEAEIWVINNASDDNTEHLIADLEIGYKNLVYIYRSNVLLDRKNLLIDVNFVHGPFKSLKNSWSFKELNNLLL